MTDQTAQPAQPQPQMQPPPCRKRRRVLFGLLLVLVAAIAGGLAGRATSGGFHRHWGHGPMQGYGFAGPLDPARVEERADRIVRHLGEDIGATYEQQDKLRAIVKSAARDLVPLAEKARFARREARGLLTQPDLDRATIEKFRAEHLALADAFSKRLAQALADANEVLTAEQRRKIADRLPPQRGWWMRGA